MTKNVGNIDKIFRLVLGLFLVSLVFWGPKTAWGYVGFIAIGTALMNYCPLYSLFGIKTCQRDS
ncbi:DUF2892 domain-containing protein [bacterium]|nr:DUF2892 domain-containing protein [bacterium]